MPVHTGISLGKILLPALGVPIERCTGAVINLPVEGLAEVTATYVADDSAEFGDLIVRRFQVLEITEVEDEAE